MTATTVSAAPPRRLATNAGLSRAEEAELAAGIARGDRAARDHMVETNLGLVRTIARDFVGRGMDADDLIGEGNLGLFRAAERFDPDRGVRFSTYAAHWIREAIRSALINTAPAIRLPVHMVRLLTRWRRAERALARQLGRMPEADEVAAAMGLSAEQRGMIDRALQSRRMHPAGGDDGNGWRGVAGRADDGAAGESLDAAEERLELRRRLGRLDDRERAVVAQHYGLAGEPQSRPEIARRLGMTREGVRRIEQSALAKLGEP